MSMHRVDHLRWALPFPRTGSALSAWVDCKEQAACSQRGQGLFALRFRLRRRQESRRWAAGTVSGLEESAAGDFLSIGLGQQTAISHPHDPAPR